MISQRVLVIAAGDFIVACQSFVARKQFERHLTSRETSQTNSETSHWISVSNGGTDYGYRKCNLEMDFRAHYGDRNVFLETHLRTDCGHRNFILKMDFKLVSQVGQFRKML